MKKRYFISIVLAGLVFSAFASTGYAGDDEEKRFYLFNAEYNSSMIQRSQTSVFLEKRLFKINRRTGETWVLVDVLRNGRDIKYWKKITEEQSEESPAVD